MTAKATSRRKSFIVRIWQEPGSPYGWRGQVVDVSSQYIDYFEDFDGLIAVLRRLIQGAQSRPDERGVMSKGQ